VTHPIAEKIAARIRARPVVVPVTDLLELGSRSAVDQALSRVVHAGTVLRVRRGLYQWPRVGKLLNRPIPPSVDELVRAWARQNRLRVIPSGAYAANLLRLSTQVPVKLVYYTNGRTRTVALGPYTVRLLNRGPRTMDVRGRLAPLVVQALRHLGRANVTPAVARRLRSLLAPGDKAELRRSLPRVAAWMRPVLEQVAGGVRR